MIYYFQKLVGVVTFLIKIQKSNGNSINLENRIKEADGELKNYLEGNFTNVEKLKEIILIRKIVSWQFTKYRTRATITRSWLETALEYYPYIRPEI